MAFANLPFIFFSEYGVLKKIIIVHNDRFLPLVEMTRTSIDLFKQSAVLGLEYVMSLALSFRSKGEIYPLH